METKAVFDVDRRIFGGVTCAKENLLLVHCVYEVAHSSTTITSAFSAPKIFDHYSNSSKIHTHMTAHAKPNGVACG
jgi:hypothetical protein